MFPVTQWTPLVMPGASHQFNWNDPCVLTGDVALAKDCLYIPLHGSFLEDMQSLDKEVALTLPGMTYIPVVRRDPRGTCYCVLDIQPQTKLYDICYKTLPLDLFKHGLVNGLKCRCHIQHEQVSVTAGEWTLRSYVSIVKLCEPLPLAVAEIYGHRVLSL